MVHTFEALGVKLAVDVNSGAVHVLDDLTYRLLPLVEPPMAAVSYTHLDVYKRQERHLRGQDPKRLLRQGGGLGRVL